MISDSVSTLISIAVIFGKIKLNMNNSQLIIGAAIVPFAAFLGGYFWLFLVRRLGMTTRQTMLMLTIFYSFLPLYGLLGFVAPIGLKNPSEIWFVCCYHGLLLGAIQSYARVLFSEMLPTGKENEMFSLYEITDKGSAWIGPLFTGLIVDLTGELRNVFWFLAAMLILPIILLWSVDTQKGQADAQEYARREKEKHML